MGPEAVCRARSSDLARRGAGRQTQRGSQSPGARRLPRASRGRARLADGGRARERERVNVIKYDHFSHGGRSWCIRHVALWGCTASGRERTSRILRAGPWPCNSSSHFFGRSTYRMFPKGGKNI